MVIFSTTSSPFYHLAEDRVVIIQPIGGRQCYEELAAVGPRPGISHCQLTWRIESHTFGDFIPELITRSTRAGPQWATALDHELGDDAMEGEPIVERPLRGLARLRVRELLCSCCQANKVLHRQRGRRGNNSQVISPKLVSKTAYLPPFKAGIGPSPSNQKFENPERTGGGAESKNSYYKLSRTQKYRA